MNAAAITDRTYRFSPEPLTSEQSAYLRSWMIHYDGPGQYAGISQYERFCGVAVSVSVHPTFPAMPEFSEQFGWRTSDRKAAIRMARAMRPTPKHSSYLYRAEAIKLMVAAANATVDFLARYYDAETGTLKTELEGYDAAAQAMYAAIGFSYSGFTAEDPRCTGMTECEISLLNGNCYGSMIWADVWSRALAIVHHEVRAPWKMANIVRLMVNEIASTLRHWSREGWLVQPAATAISDALLACING